MEEELMTQPLDSADRESEQTKQLGTEKLGKLILKFALPAVIASVVNAIYNIVDRAFVGKFVGSDALGALTVSFPLMLLMVGVSTLLGIGASALASIHLGKKENEQASKVFGNGITLLVIFGIIMTVLMLIFMKPLLTLLSATDRNIGYATDYMRIIVYAQVIQLAGFYLVSFCRIEGRPMLSMISQIIAAVTNIALDALFIIGFDWGVTGAAVATIIGQFVGFAIPAVYYFFTGRSVIKLKASYLILRGALVGGIFAIGLSSFLMQIGNFLSNMFLLGALQKYGGDEAINSMGAISSLFTLLIMPLLGMKDGIAPILGYNHGANKFDRVKRTLVISIAISFVFSAVLLVVLQVFPRTFCLLFLPENATEIDMCVNGLRLYTVTLPLICFNVIGTAYFQATAHPVQAFILSVSRQILFLIPAVLIMPLFLQLNGVWLSVPLSDIFSIALTVVLLALNFRKLSRLHTAQNSNNGDNNNAENMHI